MSEFDDPFRHYPHSRPSGRFAADGREIRLVGPPVLAWEPATNNLSVPEQYHDHALIYGRYFYTLPLNVLNAVVEELGEDRFDADLLAMERELSSMCGSHAYRVGFWHNAALPYGELRSNEEPFSDELIREAGMKPAAVNHAMRTYRERDVAVLERFARGYCGWLMTNQKFLDEHDLLLANHVETVRRWGTHHAASFLPASYRARLIPGTDPNDEPSWNEFIDDCNPFLLRWRLAGLAGPYLPIPSKPLMAGSFPLSVVQQLMGAGGIFYVPDTMPIPSQSQLRGLLDDALHGGESPEHLKEWLDIGRAGNTAKNKMDPFARMFELQHYWRILHQRHPSSISRKIGNCQGVLASFFEVSQNQIKHDLTEIRNRLGDHWLERTCPV